MNKYDKTLSKEVKQKDFIEFSIEFHNDKFDYSLVEYVNTHTKVKIICPIHGIFEQSPKSHKKYGCSKCSGRKKLTTDEFIDMSKKIHGNKYNYSLVEYENSKKKVKIKCRTHGIFEQSPHGHYNGQGCPKCGIQQRSESKKLTTEIFIERSILIHNNFYDYSKVNYIHGQKNVIINCPIHGNFEQKAMNHLIGYGCVECSNDRIRNSNNKEEGFNNFTGIDQFIEKSNKIHDNKYDYSDSIYNGSKIKVKVNCPIHGVFKIQPNAHIFQNQGCPKCGNESKRLSHSDFIEKAKKIHKGLYEYISKYVKSSEKIKIKCKNHGIFKQTPHNHLKGRGCPKCNLSKGELKISNILESMEVKFIPQKKFKKCKNKKPLPFDFYLPEKNLCIEYDGEQHFKSIENWGGIKRYKNTQKNDNIKNIFCSENNINLLRIPYTKYNEIEKIITNIIEKN